MRRSAGGVSLLLLLQSALAFIMILTGTRGENSSKMSSDESQTCSGLLAWFIVYASWLLVFRLVHEVSLHMWITGATRGLSWRLHRGIAAHLLLHLVSGPVFVLMISSGAWLIGSNVGKTCLAPNNRVLSGFFLAFAVPILLLKYCLLFSYWRTGDLAYLARTPGERRAAQASPQFLVGSADHRAPTIFVSTYTAIECGKTEFFKLRSGESALRCSICLEDLTPTSIVRDFPCNHFHHLACIDRWLASHNTCPDCRVEVRRGLSLGGREAADVEVPPVLAEDDSTTTSD